MLISGLSWKNKKVLSSEEHKRQFHDSVSCCFCVIVTKFESLFIVKQATSFQMSQHDWMWKQSMMVTLSELQACFLQGFLQLWAASAFLLQRRLQSLYCRGTGVTAGTAGTCVCPCAASAASRSSRRRPPNSPCTQNREQVNRPGSRPQTR